MWIFRDCEGKRYTPLKNLFWCFLVCTCAIFYQCDNKQGSSSGGGHWFQGTFVLWPNASHFHLQIVPWPKEGSEKFYTCVSTALSEKEGHRYHSCWSRKFVTVLLIKENILMETLSFLPAKLAEREAQLFACPASSLHPLRSCAPCCGLNVWKPGSLKEPTQKSITAHWALTEPPGKCNSNPSYSLTQRNLQCLGVWIFCVTGEQDPSLCPILPLPKEKLIGWVWDKSFM